MKRFFAIASIYIFVAACAAPPPARLPRVVDGATVYNCPSANLFAGLQDRLRDIYTGIKMVMVDNPGLFIALFNERLPRTHYSAPDKIMFAYIRSQDVGQLYLVYNDCVEGTFKMGVKEFHAMNGYRGT